MTIIPFPASRCCGMPRQGLATMTVAPRPVARPRYGAPAAMSEALSPEAAVAILSRLASQGLVVTGVELAGPGDPLATPESTLETLALIKRDQPDLPVNLVTLGLGGASLVEILAAHGLERITILADAIDPEILGRLYAWIRPGNRTIAIDEAARALLGEQARTIAAAREAGLSIDIRTTLYPGINETEIAKLGAQMKELGATTMTVLPFHPAPGEEDSPPIPDPEMLREARCRAEAWLPRAPEDARLDTNGAENPGDLILPRPSRERPNLAVVSSNGLEIDLHLGEAIYLMIYGPREDGLPCLLGTRPAPEPGGGGNRWRELAETLNDCFALLTASAGDSPHRILAESNIAVLTTKGEVEGLVDKFFGGGRKKSRKG
ncbi:MAG TPA: NifB/NifX family molybdenum-iron cluster-binding protein [Pseudodesulfovibrio sp.]|nr:NifB/NifX family molybdenum-iron cluster-binding protein [Pseudodesulfovibrio sp.]